MQQTLLPPEPPWLPALLGALASHECLATHQLAALVPVAEAAVGPVLECLLRRRQVRSLDHGASSRGYALTLRGARLLAELTGEEAPAVPRAKSSALLSHELTKNDLAVVLHLLDGAGRLNLLRWETARDALADAVTVVRGTKAQRIPLVADALAVVDAGAGPTALLVEIDMGTVSLARMKTKYEGYVAWRKIGGPERRFGTKSLRVLTIAAQPTRMVRLRATAAEAAGSEAPGFLWFATADVLDVDAPETLFAPRFTTAHVEPQARPLFERRA